MKDAVLQKKQAVVAEIKEKLENASSVVLVDYRGLTVEEVTQLRKDYRDNGVDYKVYKNTLMEFAFKELGHEGMIEYLNGPNALVIAGEDVTSAARVTQAFAKTNEKLEIKAGLLDGKVLDMAGVKELADIPSREVLLAKLLGSLKAPMSNLAYMLSAYASKKEEEGDAVAEPVDEEAPVAEAVEEAPVVEAVEETAEVEETPEVCPVEVEETEEVASEEE